MLGWQDCADEKSQTLSRNRIKILNKEEQEGMRKVCRLAREVLDIAAQAVKPGVTTDQIDKIVHDACMERDVRRNSSHEARGSLANVHHSPTRPR